MDPAAQKRRRQKRRFFWAIVAAVVLLPMSAALYVTFGPNPPIRISKATTHITSPLDENGLPDYAAALLAEMRKGVTPENNGAVPFLQAMWGSCDEALDPADARLVCDALGMAYPPSPDLRIEDFWSEPMRLAALRLYRGRVPKAEPQASPDTETFEFDGEVFGIEMNDAAFWSAPEEDVLYDLRVESVLDLAMDRDWTAEDAPFIAEWLDENQAGFARLLEAAERPRWFLPEPGLLRTTSDAMSLLEMWHIMQLRAAARYYSIAMGRHQGEGRYDEAADCALGTVRFAGLLSEEPYLVDHLLAVAIEGIGLELIQRLASDASTPKSTLLEALDRLNEVGRANSLPRLKLTGERFFALHFAKDASQHGIESFDGLLGIDWPTESVRPLSNHFSVDWNEVLIATNQQYDRLEGAIAAPTRAQRLADFDLIDSQTAFRDDRIANMWREPGRFLTSAGRGRLVADAHLATHVFTYGNLIAVDDRMQTKYNLTRLLLQTAIHRAEHGDWPGSIDQIDTNAFGDCRADVFNGSAYRYHRTKDGVLLYSCGPNGIDDSGSNAGGENGGYGSSVLEGVEIDALDLYTLTPEEQTMIEQIPEGADDQAIRAPLPIKPWPWEKQPAKSE